MQVDPSMVLHFRYFGGDSILESRYTRNRSSMCGMYPWLLLGFVPIYFSSI